MPPPPTKSTSAKTRRISASQTSPSPTITTDFVSVGRSHTQWLAEATPDDSDPFGYISDTVVESDTDAETDVAQASLEAGAAPELMIDDLGDMALLEVGAATDSMIDDVGDTSATDNSLGGHRDDAFFDMGMFDAL